MRICFVLIFTLFYACGSLKKSQKEAVHIEKKEIKISRKKDSVHSVFAEKKHVVLEDTGRIITYELTAPAALKEITKGTALVHKIVIEEKKIIQKVTQKKDIQTTAITQQKDSASAVIKEHKTQERSIKKKLQTWSLWLWIIGAIAIIAAISFLFKRYLKWF